MAEHRGRAEWGRTATLCAAIVNSNPFRKGKPAQPDDFMPSAYKPKRGKLRVGIEALMVFLPKEARPPEYRN